MSEEKIFVSGGGSLSVCGTSYMPGQVLPEDACKALKESGELDKLVEGGVLETLSGRLAALEEGAKPENSDITLTEGKVEQKKKDTPPGITPGAGGVWVFDPAELGDRSLDQLNVMIKEIDADAPACEDVAEAIAFLSQDFEGEEG